MARRSRTPLLICITLWMLAAFSPSEASRSYRSSLPPAYDAAVKAFEAFVAERMAFDHVPGMSVAFIKDDALWAKGFGYADRENQVPAAPESAYRLASITKTITAVGVLQLVEEGKIDLDAEIQTYVPYFPRKKWPVTVRQLLGHVSGITNYRNYAVETRIKEPKNTREALAIFQDFDLVGEPGTVYNYSTYGFNLLGAAVEGASGESYGDYIRKRIFEPLGMKDSRVESAQDLIPNRVRGYVFADGELRNSEFVDVSSRFGGGGTRSTVLDLMKYSRAIMDGKLLKEETRRQMFSSMVLRNGFLTGYGMGWTVQPWSGHFAVRHSGFQPETRTYLLIFPRDRFAVAAAANLESVDLVPYVRRLADLVLGEDLTLAAYGPDRESRAILTALFQTYSYGLSYLDWNGTPLVRNRDELAQAFDFFNRTVNRKALKADFAPAVEKISTGIHLASNRAFTGVGSYMAATLAQTGGRERLESCRKNGPLAFFNDYIRLSGDRNAGKDRPRLEADLAGLIKKWEKEWSSARTEYVRTLAITPGTDFGAMEELLLKGFKGASVYPDFTADLAALAQNYQEQNMLAKTFQILETGRKIYPNAPGLLVSLAWAHLWAGHIGPAQALFRQAFNLDATDRDVDFGPMADRAGRFVRTKRMNEAMAVCDLALEFHPRNAKAHERMAGVCLEAGQKEKALKLLRRAVILDPKLGSAKEKIRFIEKQK